MDDLWQQFHRLPRTIRDAVATPRALAAVEQIEKNHPGLDLADIVMRLMVKEFPIGEVPNKLQAEAKLNETTSQAVTEQLKKDVLGGVADYLGFADMGEKPEAGQKKPAATTVSLVTKPTSPPTVPRPAWAPPVQPKTAASARSGLTPLGIPPGAPAKVTPTPSATPGGLGQPRPAALPPTQTGTGAGGAASVNQVRPPIPPGVTSPAQLGGKPPVAPTPAKTLTPLVAPVAAGRGSGQVPKAVIPVTPVVPVGIVGGLGQPPKAITPVPITPISPAQVGGLGQPRPVTPPAPVKAVPPIPAVAAPRAPIGAIAPTQEYSEQDAAEIEQQLARIKSLPGEVSDFDELAKRILDQHHLAWPDELMTRRAVAIAKARLKEIRTSDMTEQVLTRDPKIGGLGLDPDIARQLAATLDTEAAALKSRGMVRPPVSPTPPPPVLTPPIQAAQPPGQPPLTRVVPVTGLPPAVPLTNVTEPPRPSRPIKRPADIPAPVSAPVPVTKPPPAPVPVVMQRPREQDRPRIADISRPTKTYGPGEEMKSLTLTEWRRLGQGAVESARVLLEKFKNLQRESFSLWTAALNGWRLSEVYQLYLAMGRQSLEQGITVQEVIATRARSGQLYLSEHEFFTIADLNRQLQYY